jgi:hypothetical protein
MRVLSFLVASIVSLSASAVWAGQPAGSRVADDHARLEKKADRVEARLRGKTGAHERERLRRQQQEIDDLIRRIERGEAVSPSDVDDAVRNVPRPGPKVGPNR